ncbi:MAG: hypothetical protein OJF49_002750 [Ktedonobacterales bacterium]|nr:MAG: hypothetical protein OJF49_002750 [Ktedonobacterales bacterium]
MPVDLVAASRRIEYVLFSLLGFFGALTAILMPAMLIS